MPGPSLEVRIAQRITSDGSAIIPPRIARWLEQRCGITDDRRALLRGTDAEAYEVLYALHLSAIGADCGTKQAAAQGDNADLSTWLSTIEAADALHVTDRCIRKWCQTGRLRAVLKGSRWLVDPNTITLTDIGDTR